MRAINFPQATLQLAKDQDQYATLPIYLNPNDQQGNAVSCWELDEVDIQRLVLTKKLWLGQLTFHRGFAPVWVSAEMPNFPARAEIEAIKEQINIRDREATSKEQEALEGYSAFEQPNEEPIPNNKSGLFDTVGFDRFDDFMLLMMRMRRDILTDDFLEDLFVKADVRGRLVVAGVHKIMTFIQLQMEEDKIETIGLTYVRFHQLSLLCDYILSLMRLSPQLFNDYTVDDAELILAKGKELYSKL